MGVGGGMRGRGNGGGGMRGRGNGGWNERKEGLERRGWNDSRDGGGGGMRGNCCFKFFCIQGIP